MNVVKSHFARFAVLALLGCQALAVAADNQPNGRQIYRQQCAKCHGETGEGVKDKYAEPLQGDWSITRLTRVIARTMPEEDPSQCVGTDAEAVARYVFDTFYSREARARTHPARVELVRLTNRQYLNTAADLLKHFSGTGATIDDERGLRGAYYNARNFARDKKVHDRLDRGIDFDFGEGSPDVELIQAEAFSMQWSGSLLAEETGNYEFILKTPNGARLWINDEEQALIDAWVATGELTEHRAALRLIGGRAYPLRLEYFKFKDKTASVSLQWKAPHRSEEPIPARNFSPRRVTPTLVITTRFPPDDSSVGYERGVAVSKAWDEATTDAAIEVANYVLRNLDALSRSKPADADRQLKVEAFCQQFVETAFRRPLDEEQRRIYITSQFKASDKLENGVRRVVLLALKSPRFLYLGLAGNPPDDFEVAARLSFALWDSLPDGELAKAAAEGKLRTRAEIVEQANRMLADPRTRAKLLYFAHHWLQMSHLEDLAKDAGLYPGFTPEIIADLRTSLNLFLNDAFWNAAANYRELLLGNHLYLNERLAKFYGLEFDAPDDFVKVSFDPKQRSGVLTHPYLLAAFSYPKTTSPIHRGVFLTRNIIGRALKPPPNAVEFTETDFAPNLTMREKVAELTRPMACQTCHSVINPLGFSLENYDAVGRFRTVENDREIDASSDYTTDEGEVIRLTGARDVAEFALNSEPAQNAFVEQLFHQLVKQPLLAYGPDVPDRLRQSFIESDFNVQKLLVEIAAIAAWHGVEPVKSL